MIYIWVQSVLRGVFTEKLKRKEVSIHKYLSWAFIFSLVFWIVFRRFFGYIVCLWLKSHLLIGADEMVLSFALLWRLSVTFQTVTIGNSISAMRSLEWMLTCCIRSRHEMKKIFPHTGMHWMKRFSILD